MPLRHTVQLRASRSYCVRAKDCSTQPLSPSSDYHSINNAQLQIGIDWHRFSTYYVLSISYRAVAVSLLDYCHLLQFIETPTVPTVWLQYNYSTKLRVFFFIVFIALIAAD